MENTIIFILGFLFGIVIMSLLNASKISELMEESLKAEARAFTHFSKLFKIDRILRRAEIDKTPAVIVVDKIKEVITDSESQITSK